MVVVCATSVHVFYRTSVRSNVCSLAVWRVVCYVRARSFVCDHVRARRGHVVAVAVPWRGRRTLDIVTWPWRPWVWPWRGVAVAVVSAVFVSPSCGCDTPTNASVCNGFGGVCVVLVCYLTG